MNGFKSFHPIVNFIYFVFVIGFSMFFMHPITLCISFVCGFLYSVMLKGTKAIKTNLMYMLPMMIITGLINPLFNHDGVTIISYFPNGNPLTLESIIYGIAAAVMIAEVICWFSCYNFVMTSDKFIYLFGRIIPSLSLIISMTLRFVPGFIEHLKEVSESQKCMGRDMSGGSIIKRAKCGLTILSATVTWAFENSVDTADSMKSRGYGLKGRSAFAIFKFDKRDAFVLFTILALGIYVLVGSISGKIYYTYFPSMQGTGIAVWSITMFTAHLMLCVLPVIIEIREVIKWKAIKSKI